MGVDGRFVIVDFVIFGVVGKKLIVIDFIIIFFRVILKDIFYGIILFLNILRSLGGGIEGWGFSAFRGSWGYLLFVWVIVFFFDK